jgi:colanic acid biosynthesis glycosyl transferase WcaI
VRVLIYSINFFPELVGIGKYTGEMATWFAEQGDEVRVITAPPYYPDWQVQAPYHSFWYRNESLAKNLSVLRCPLWVPPKPSGLTRILHLFGFAFGSFFPMLWQVMWKPDKIIVIEPPFFCAPISWLSARLSGAKACLHVQDFEVDAAFDLGLLKSKWLQRLVLFLESTMMRRFDKVFTISPKMLEKLEQKKIPQKNCDLFPNWVDTQTIYPLENKSLFRKFWKITDKQIVLLYSGNIGAKQGLETIIEVARQLQGESRFIFVICGQGAFYPQLREQAENIKNIQWHELQPLEKLNDLLNLADIHLLPQRADAADLVMPSKLTGMLASGKPIIATALPGTQVADVVIETGLIVPPDNPSALLQAIRELADNPEMRRNLGKKSRNYAIKYLDKDKVLSDFRQKLKNL